MFDIDCHDVRICLDQHIGKYYFEANVGRVKMEHASVLFSFILNI